MPQLKITTWNTEWLNNCFKNNQPKPDEKYQSQLTQLGAGVDDLSPDVLILQEGPNEYAEMQAFLDGFVTEPYIPIRAALRDKNPVTGKKYGDTQLNWILYKNNGKISHTSMQNTETSGPFMDWKATIHPDIGEEQFFHHRLPVEIDLTYNDGNVTSKPIKIIGVHPKSKKASDEPGSAEENRRILLAQAIDIRNYIDFLLDKDSKKHIMICGDMNDGIGLDPFEYHLGGDFASIVTGSVRKPYQVFTNACANQIIENIELPGTHHSLTFREGNKTRKLLIDHLLFSPSFKSSSIVLDENSGKIRNDILHAHPKASDHAPVEASITIS